MIKFNWHIKSIDCYKSKNNLENVVYNVRWIYTGIDDVNNVSWSIDGVTSLPDPDLTNFTLINNISESLIITWLQEILDVSGMGTEITNKINDIINSNTFTITLDDIK